MPNTCFQDAVNDVPSIISKNTSGGIPFDTLQKYGGHIQDDIIDSWLVVSTPLKNMKVSWGYYSQLNGKKNPNVPNHQPDSNVSICGLLIKTSYPLVMTNSSPWKPWP